MKHIWQSTQQHTTGSFNVTENVPSLTPGAYLRAIISLPRGHRLEKLIAVCQCANPGDTKEDISQPPSVRCSGRCATPGQSLPLYMNQTTLNHHSRPNLTQLLHHFRIAIYGKAIRIQSGLFQTLKEFLQLWFRIFRDIVLASYKHVCLGIHQSNKAAGTVQEGPVKDEMLILRRSRKGLYRRLFQIVVDHTVKLPWTIAALIGQLPDRITFNNPESKQSPLFFPIELATPAPSTVRMSARSTEPALFPFSIMTISP